VSSRPSALPLPLAIRPAGGEALLGGAVAILAASAAVLVGPKALAIPIVAALVVFLLREPLALLALFLEVGLFKDEAVVKSLPVDATLALGLLIAAVCGVRLVTGRARAVPFGYALTIAVVAISLVVSLGWSDGGGYGHNKVTTFLTVTMLAIGAPFFLFETWNDLRRFFMWTVVVAFPVAILALTHPARDSGRLAGDNTIGTSHLLCTAALILLLSALGGSRRRVLATLGAATFIAIAAAVGSRGPILSLAVALLVTVTAWLLRVPRKVAPVLAVAAIGVAVVPFVSLPATSSERLSSAARDPLAAYRHDDRYGLAKEAVKLIDAHPIRGAGAGAFSAVDPVTKWPHNIFLELWSELGIIAVVTVAASIVIALLGLFRTAWRLPEHGREQQLAYILLAVFVFNAVTVQITGDINQNRVFWGMLAIAWLVVAGKLTPARDGDARTAS
jgi:O-antigen ligase